MREGARPNDLDRQGGKARGEGDDPQPRGDQGLRDNGLRDRGGAAARERDCRQPHEQIKPHGQQIRAGKAKPGGQDEPRCQGPQRAPGCIHRIERRPFAPQRVAGANDVLAHQGQRAPHQNGRGQKDRRRHDRLEQGFQNRIAAHQPDKHRVGAQIHVGHQKMPERGGGHTNLDQPEGAQRMRQPRGDAPEGPAANRDASEENRNRQCRRLRSGAKQQPQFAHPQHLVDQRGGP